MLTRKTELVIERFYFFGADYVGFTQHTELAPLLAINYLDGYRDFTGHS